MKLINPNIIEFEDILSYFEDSYYYILEDTNKIDDLYWEIEKEDINGRLALSLEEVIKMLSKKLNAIYSAEAYLFKELKLIMPEQSLSSALESENESILKLLNSLNSVINKKENLKKQKDIIQAEMIALVDIVQRNIHKKINIFLHEIRTLLPEERQEEVSSKLMYLTK